MRTPILGSRPDGVPVADPRARDRRPRARRAHRPGGGAAGAVSPGVAGALARAGWALPAGRLPGRRADGPSGGMVHRSPGRALHVRARSARGRLDDRARRVEPGLRPAPLPARARRVRLQRAEPRDRPGRGGVVSAARARDRDGCEADRPHPGWTGGGPSPRLGFSRSHRRRSSRSSTARSRLTRRPRRSSGHVSRSSASFFGGPRFSSCSVAGWRSRSPSPR